MIGRTEVDHPRYRLQELRLISLVRQTRLQKPTKFHPYPW